MKTPPIRAAFLSVALAMAGTQPALAQDQAGVSALVQLTPLMQGKLPKQVRGFGRVIPAEAARTAITADVAGEVSTVDVYQGEFVRKGAKLMTIAPSAEMLSSYKQAQLAVQFARQLLEETRSLLQAHLKTRADLEIQQQALANARLKLAALRQIGADGPRRVVAPHDAVVLVLNAGPGAAVSKGAQLADLADPSDLLLDVQIPPNEARNIAVGHAAKIVATDSGATFHGKVVSKSGMVSTAGGLARVQVSVPKGKMMIGEHAMALIDEARMAGYLVPHSAILVNDGGHAYVVQSVHGTGHLVPVDVVASGGGKDIVQGKLVPGADIVLAGNHQVTEGMKLRVQSAAVQSAAAQPRAGSK